MRWRRGGAPSGSACPFCKGLFAVTYRGPLSDKDVAVLAAERAALAAAQQRAREVGLISAAYLCEGHGMHAETCHAPEMRLAWLGCCMPAAPLPACVWTCRCFVADNI